METNQWQFFTFSAIFLTIFFNWLINFVNRCKTFPPGPWGLPIVGYTPWLGKAPFEVFYKTAQKYGNIFSVNLGNTTAVVLNDWESVKEALVNQPKAFSGRPYSFVLDALFQGKNIASNDGPVWKTQRNLTMQILRSLGVGKNSMENRVMDMVHEVMDIFSQADEKIQCMKSVFFGPMLKTNWNIVSGSEDQTSNELKEFENLVTFVFEDMSMDNPINAFPWLRFIPPNGFGYWNSIRKSNRFVSYLKKLVDQHVIYWKEGKLDDFIDYYLSEIDKHKAETGIEEAPFNVDHLVFTLYDLFLGGVDTTNATLTWGFLHLALNPLIQKKAQDELDEVVGRHRLPTMSDMSRLPYIEAVIMEIHRVATIAPFSAPHRTTETVNLLGHTIPKDTTVIQNIYAVHKDSKVWVEPEVFKPERFFNANKVIKAPPYLMPFSIGPRICPGQSVAEMELKLILSCLLHQFSFTIPQDRPLPSLEPIMGIIVKPHPYALLINKRKE